MNHQTTKQIIVAGALIAIGLVLPMAFHAIGGGAVFLPMHIPVLIGGFCLSTPFAIAVGVFTPLLSSMLTGMPPVFPVLPFMMIELATYGLMVSVCYRKCNWHVYPTLIASMIAGRIMAGISVWILAEFFLAKLPGPIVFVTGALAKGIPGIIIQLIFIPVIVLSVQRLNGAQKSQRAI